MPSFDDTFRLWLLKLELSDEHLVRIKGSIVVGTVGSVSTGPGVAHLTNFFPYKSPLSL